MADIELPPQPIQREGNTTLLIVAIVMALVTVILTNLYIGMVRSEMAESGVEYYKLVRTIEPGEYIRDNDLKPARTTADFAESIPGLIRPEDKNIYVNNKNSPVMRMVYEGEPLVTDIFTAPSHQVDHKITAGKRGCPLPLSSRTAPGLLKPGMYVDILGTFPMGGSQLPRTFVVIPSVKVIAVGSITEQRDTDRRMNYSNITIEVEPRDAEHLVAIAKYIGKEGFDVLIRQPKDAQPGIAGVSAEVLKLVGIER